MKYEDLIKTPEYWTTKMQLDLYEKVEKYMTDHQLNRSDLAKKLGVSKGYVTQLLNGDSDHRMSKLAELALSIGYYPTLDFKRIEMNQEEKSEAIANAIQQLKKMKCHVMVCPKPEKNIDALIFDDNQEDSFYQQIS